MSSAVYSNLHSDTQFHPNDRDIQLISDEEAQIAKQLKFNFYLFSFLYSIIHGAVDCVIAFSSAELGTTLGSYGGFTLYIFYTLSSLFCAKPVFFLSGSSKFAILIGLFGLLCYVISFYLSLIFYSYKYILFLIGAAIGGIGAGLLWTSQGIYFTLNAKLFSFYQNQNKLTCIYDFAAIFAIFYLLLEAVLQFISTLVYFIYQESSNHHHNDENNSLQSWRRIVFGIYTLIACLSLLFYWFIIMDLKDDDQATKNNHDERGDVNYQNVRNIDLDDVGIDIESESSNGGGDYLDTSLFPKSPSSSSHHHNSDKKKEKTKSNRSAERLTPTAVSPALPLHHRSSSSSSFSSLSSPTSSYCCSCAHYRSRPERPSHNNKEQYTQKLDDVLPHIIAVGRAIVTIPKLQLLLPYQITFGFSAGLVQTYVNGVIVNDFLGDGFIGLLAGLITLTAVLIAQPLAIISNHYPTGKKWIMISGGICFAIGGLAILCFSNHLLSRWEIIIPYYLLHGIARGIWENTNKAIVAEFFPSSQQYRDVAFASIYFASGLSGALGFIFFQFLSIKVIALINLLMAMIAIVGFLWAQMIHEKELKEQTLSSIHQLTESSSRSSSSSSLNDLT